MRIRLFVGALALCALAAVPATPARADINLGFFHWGRQPRPQTVQLQATLPACAVCAPAMAVVAPVAAPAPQPISLQLLVTPPQAPPPPAPVQAAPVMLQVAPPQQPDQYWILRRDGATGQLSVAPAAPR